MNRKYILLPLLFIFFNFSVEAQDDKKAIDPNTSQKVTKKTKKEIKIQESNRIPIATSEAQLEIKPSTTRPQTPALPTTIVSPPLNETKIPAQPAASVKPAINETQNNNPTPNNIPQTNDIPDISFLEQYIEEIIEEQTNGNINWSQQYVEAKGQSVIDNVRFTNVAQAKAMATRGAIVVAQRNLLEMVQGVNVVGETTVEDMITTSDYIYTRVEGFVKGAEQIGPAREVNGLIEVTLRIPIYGNKGIAKAFEPSDIVQAKRNNGYKSLAQDTQQDQEQTFENVIDGSKPFVFNILGKEIDPSMFPVVVDNEGNIQFDFSDLYETKTGKFPQFVQLSKELMNDIGFQKGVDVINLVQNGKGEFNLSKDNKKGIFWQKLGKAAKGIGKFLFNIVA
jgi:hypothetical protein